MSMNHQLSNIMMQENLPPLLLNFLNSKNILRIKNMLKIKLTNVSAIFVELFTNSVGLSTNCSISSFEVNIKGNKTLFIKLEIKDKKK